MSSAGRVSIERFLKARSNYSSNGKKTDLEKAPALYRDTSGRSIVTDYQFIRIKLPSGRIVPALPEGP